MINATVTIGHEGDTIVDTKFYPYLLGYVSLDQSGGLNNWQKADIFYLS